MKTFKFIILAMLVLGLGASQVQAQPSQVGISVSISGHFQGTAVQADTGHAGDIIEYDVTVSLNATQYPITNGVVRLYIPGAVTYMTLDSSLTLASGGSHTYTNVGTYTVDNADFGTWDDGFPFASPNIVRGYTTVAAIAHTSSTTTQNASAAGDWDTLVVTPCLEITKTPDTDVSKAGDTINYTIDITNCGDTPLYLVSVYDDLIGDLNDIVISNGGDVLDINETCEIIVSYDVQEGDPDPIVNTVTAEYEDQIGDPNTHEKLIVDANATVDLVHPDFTVSKNCPESAEVGDTITYSVTITNTGDVGLEILSADDSVYGSLGINGTIIASGNYYSVDYDYIIQTGDPNPLFNTVTVVAGLDQNEAPLPNELTRDANCTTNLDQPGTTVSISASSTSVCEGDTVTLTICEENTGNVPLTDVSVDLYAGGLYYDTILMPDLDVNEYSCVDYDVVVDTNTTYEVYGYALDPEQNEISYENGYDNEYAYVDIEATPCGTEGCTPGFWKNNARNWEANAWCEPELADATFSEIFGVDITIFLGGNPKNANNYLEDPTLYEALGANGSGVNLLARSAVAALLNACSDCVNYGLSVEQVLGMVLDAFDENGNLIDNDLGSYFDYLNNMGCPINQQGECVGIVY